MIEWNAEGFSEQKGERLAWAILDFGEVWTAHWLPLASTSAPVLTAFETCAVQTILTTVPPVGLSEAQVRCVYDWVGRGTEVIFAASIDPFQLEEGDRELPGYILLRSEVSRQFNRDLLMIPQAAELARQFVPRMIIAVSNLGQSRETLRLVERDEQFAEQQMQEAWSFVDLPLDTLSSILLALIETERAEALLPLVLNLDSSKSQATALRRESEGTLAYLALETAAACRREATKRPVMFGRFTEHIVTEIADVVESVRSRMMGEKWSQCSIEQMAACRGRILEEFEGSGITLPLVGRFSSGKTTLLNHLLGSTPNGHKLLRTAATHNTALLARFHYCDPSKQHVKFTYRPNIFELKLCSPGTGDETAACAPCDGTIVRVNTEDSGDTVVTIEDALDGALHSVRITPPLRPLERVKRGHSVRVGDAVATGISRPELLQQALAEPDAIVSFDADVKDRVIKLLLERKLVFPAFRAQFREPEGRDFVLRERTYDEGDPSSLVRWVECLRTDERNGSCRLNPTKSHAQLLENLFSASVDPAMCIQEHALESDEDWDWFQGPTEIRESRVVRDEDRGFAEGADAELIVQRADIYLNGPLFRLINIVDTPGLSSTNPLHSATTEEFIRRGTAFLVLLRLENACTDVATIKLFDLICDALHTKNVPAAEHRDHVFIALNRFRRGDDQSSLHHVRGMQKLANACFGQPVTLHIIDLKEQGSAEQMAEELLGYPSLTPFLRAIRRYVAKRGIADKLEVAWKDLEVSWTRAKDRLWQDRKSLDGRSVDVILKTLEDIRPDICTAVTRVRRFASHRIAKLKTAAEEIANLFSGLCNKDSYLWAQTDTSVKDYEKVRLDLMHITSYARIEISRALKDVVEPPHFGGVTNRAEQVPVLSATLFADAIDDVVRCWPDKLSGISNWFSRLLDDGDFIRHGTVEQKRLRSTYFSDATQSAIYITLDSLETAIADNLREVEREALKRIDERSKSLRLQAENLVEAGKEWAARSKALEDFRPVYEKTVAEIEQYRANIQRIVERE